MKRLKIVLSALFCMILFSACNSNDLEEETVDSNTGTFTVRTRTPGTEAKVSYPLVLYVFNALKCCAAQSVQSENENVVMSLPAGEYNVYAIGGVDNLSLPEMANAQSTSLLNLKSAEQAYGDLMAAHSSVSVVAGKSQDVNLQMERKVMQLDKVEMKNIPQGTEQVSIVISSLHSGIKIDGSYSDNKDYSYELQLVKQEDNTTWSATPSAFLLPSDETTVSVKMKIGETEKTFAYTGSDKFVANSHFTITATYQAQKLEMKFTGAVWGEDKQIDFSLVDDNPNPGTSTGAQIFKVGDFYKGCYVFEVDENERIAKVLSSIEKVPAPSDPKKTIALSTNAEITEIINGYLSLWTVEGIAVQWRVMNVDEAQILYDNYTAINTALSNQCATALSTETYYVNDNQEYKKCELKAKTFKPVANPKNETILRPIAEIPF